MLDSITDAFYDVCEMIRFIFAENAVTMLAALPLCLMIFGAYEIISLMIESGPKI